MRLAVLLATLAIPCLAQTFNPSITAGEPEATPKKSDPAGLGSLMRDRPKGAKTEITARKQATFDNASGVATFEGNVIVRDPQMTLNCDKLIVTLDKARKGMEKSEAEGNVVIVHEGTDQSGKPAKSIGRGQKAIYYPATGDLVLTGWPQIQQNINNHVSTEEGTVMTLNREGKLNTSGASKTLIVETAAVGQ